MDRLGVTGEFNLTLLSVFNGVLIGLVVIVLLRIFPPYGNKKPPTSPGGGGD